MARVIVVLGPPDGSLSSCLGFWPSPMSEIQQLSQPNSFKMRHFMELGYSKLENYYFYF